MPTLEDRIRVLPCFSGSVAVSPLHGGLSNQNFLVVDDAGRYVVRFGQDYAFHHVSREREVMSARAAALAGFGPAVRYAAPGVLVTAYLGARTFEAADVRMNADAIATLLRRFHTEMPRHVSGPAYLFWVFHVIRDYARMLTAAGSRHAAALPRLLEAAEALEAAQVPLPIILGHNDLLPANVLDDGDRLWLIDFEYAGFSTAMFDLAGLASNADMDDAQSAALLTAYFGRPPDVALSRAHQAMQCASLLREALWGMVSERHLETPGVDYAVYAADNLQRFEAALDRYRSHEGKNRR